MVQLGYEDPREKAAAGQLNQDLTEEDELYSFIKQTEGTQAMPAKN